MKKLFHATQGRLITQSTPTRKKANKREKNKRKIPF